MLPLIGNSRFRITFDVDGRPPARPGEETALDIRVATPGYLPTVGIPLRRGRLFTNADRQGSQPVALLNETAVREHFPNEDPIGKRIVMGWGRDSTTVTGTVVGIVGDVKQSSLDVPTVSEIWFPHAQLPLTEMSVVVQAQRDPAELGAVVRRTVQGLDADLPVSDFRTLESVVARSVAQPRLYATLLAVFAALALLLAALGVFGVMTYAVAQRTREIGIRMALGAAGGDVVRMIVRGGLTLAGAGVVIGLAVALVATRVLRSLLFGVSATDPATFAGVAVLLVGVALVASWIPARAATRIDPNVALRAE
jgi:putative ABC transport system permease protein